MSMLAYVSCTVTVMTIDNKYFSTQLQLQTRFSQNCKFAGWPTLVLDASIHVVGPLLKKVISRFEVDFKSLSCQVSSSRFDTKSPTSSRLEVVLGQSGVRLAEQSDSQV